MNVAALLLLASLISPRVAPPPEDTFEVVASKQGFRPQVLTARKGEAIRLVLKSADGDHCFAVDELRVEKRIRAGRATTLDLTPDRAGRFDFYCCVESGEAASKQRGKLVVSE